MKIYITCAESYLKDMLQGMTKNPSSWRAISYDFSSISPSIKKQVDIIRLARTFKGLFETQDGSIYILNTLDIVIVFQGASQKIVTTLTENQSALFPEEFLMAASRPPFEIWDVAANTDSFLAKAQELIARVRPELDNNVQEKLNPELFKFNQDFLNVALAARKTRHKPEILIVEDDLFTRRLLLSVLEPGLKVHEAETGLKALTTYEKHAPDLVFLDINLPDINGHEVLKKILGIDPNANIIMLSGNMFMSEIKGAVNEGAKGFIGKPFTKNKLFEYITRFTGFKTAG